MQNFKVNHEGKEYWISRSMTVVATVIAIENDGKDFYVLANKRGKGCPDCVGQWNLPCGYLDYDESLVEACSREVKEETGLEIDPKYFVMHSINSNPLENRQNVSVRFCTFISSRLELPEVKNLQGGEKEEVDAIEWIDVAKLGNYDWAFNHQYIISEIVEYGRQVLQQQRVSQETDQEVAKVEETDRCS